MTIPFFFHLLANGRHRKTKLYRLEQDEGTVVGDENLKTYITQFYKKLFGEWNANDFSLDESQ